MYTAVANDSILNSSTHACPPFFRLLFTPQKNIMQNTESLTLSHPIFTQLCQRTATMQMREDGNLQILQDAQENFDAWLAAIAAAERYILMEMYIFATNDFGRKVRDLLLKKQQAGVQIVLVYDWLGSINAWATGFFNTLRNSGAHIVAYNPFGFARGLGLLSRNHRKSIVIDGETAFVSGLCISSAWFGQPEKKHRRMARHRRATLWQHRARCDCRVTRHTAIAKANIA